MNAPRDDSQLTQAFALTERLMSPRDGGGTQVLTRPVSAFRKRLRYWLWRLKGRRRPLGEAARVAETYEHEIERLTAAHAKALDRERGKVAKLEELTKQLQRAFELQTEKRAGAHQTATENLQKAHAAETEALMAELGRLRAELDDQRARAASTPTAELERSQTRAAEAEERARLAENKVEVLKEALDITRARAATTLPAGSGGSDQRFRDAKRAFARAFHPDQGGRDDAGKQQLFLEFWPVLEQIERGE